MASRPWPQLVLATRNPGKVGEMRALLAGLRLEVLGLDDVGFDGDLPETGHSCRANAVSKARACCRAVGRPALADDSGLEVDALGGKPGPMSARLTEGGDAANNDRLLEMLRHVPLGRRSARFRCVAALGLPDGMLEVVEATCGGRLLTKPRGTGGFGYDPLFVPEGCGRTFAEMEPGAKDAVSHRGLALRRMREVLEVLLREGRLRPPN